MSSAPHLFDRGDANWDVMARNLLEGNGLLIDRVGPPRTPMYAHRPPLYPLTLAATYTIGGRRPAAVVTMQILLALAGTWTIYRLGSRVLGLRSVGYLAALTTAIYPPLAVHDVQVMDSTLFRLLVALLTLALYRAGTRPRRSKVLAVGIFAGLAVLTRTSIALFLPLAALWLVFAWRRDAKRLIPLAAWGAIAFAVTLSPWLVRNAVHFGRLHLLTGSGKSLWMSTSKEFLEFFPERSVDHAESVRWKKLPRLDRRALRAMGELEQDQEFGRRAREDLRQNPDRIPRLVVMKAVAAFSWAHNPGTNADQLDQAVGSRKEAAYTFSYGPLLLLGIAGLIGLLFSRPAAGVLILLQFAGFLAVTVVFWAHSRHRFYLDPLLALTASWFVIRAVHRYREWRAGSEGVGAGSPHRG